MHQDIVNNKYTLWYLTFIELRKHRRISESTYVEKHHILPRSLGGGDEPSNLVTLTAREHFIAHLLLSKMFTGLSEIKMALALRAMSSLNVSGRRTKLTSKQYEIVKNINNRLFKKIGKKHREETDLQENLLDEDFDPKEVLIKGLCKSCGLRPRGINYYKGDRVFYRSTCDSCARKKKNSPTPKWMIEGYQKKPKCECCGFVAEFKEQLVVIDYKDSYTTICLNCKMSIKLGKDLRIPRTRLTPDL